MASRSRSISVVSIAETRPQQALENLNRITGLEFESVPESLVKTNRVSIIESDLDLEDALHCAISGNSFSTL